MTVRLEVCTSLELHLLPVTEWRADQQSVLLTPEPLSEAEKLALKLLSRVATGQAMLSMAGGTVSTRKLARSGCAVLPRRSRALTAKL